MCLRCKLWDSAETHAQTRAWRTQKNLGVPAKRDFHDMGSWAPARAGSRCRSVIGSFHNEAIPRFSVLP
jgi:hypothetical protein